MYKTNSNYLLFIQLDNQNLKTSYWSDSGELEKKEVQAKYRITKKLSPCGGQLICEQRGNRVMMGGKCVFYMRGEIEV